MTYDEFGNLETWTDGENRTWRYTYDSLGALESIVPPSGEANLAHTEVAASRPPSVSRLSPRAFPQPSQSGRRIRVSSGHWWLPTAELPPG